MYTKDDMICSFCVNDYHLAVMLIPYIYEAINEGKKVVTFFDRDLEAISRKVIDTNKKFWENQVIFEKVDLQKTRFDRLSEKFENVQDNDIIIVAGKDDFIERMNRLLINFHTNFTIVNCFNISDIAKNENFKISDYAKILNTKGLEETQNYDLV
ncbi:MAG: hypothetical protein IJ867_08990 [Clostridia bacterium]|nr:hypothetical protein [Clostridia bacterium]